MTDSTIAVVALNKTLIINSYNATKLLASDRELSGPPVLNINIVSALKESQIMDIYLIADSDVSKDSKDPNYISPAQTAQILKRMGFTVRGIIDASRAKFNHEQFLNTLPKKYNNLVTIDNNNDRLKAFQEAADNTAGIQLTTVFCPAQSVDKIHSKSKEEFIREIKKFQQQNELGVIAESVAYITAIRQAIETKYPKYSKPETNNDRGTKRAIQLEMACRHYLADPNKTLVKYNTLLANIDSIIARKDYKYGSRIYNYFFRSAQQPSLSSVLKEAKEQYMRQNIFVDKPPQQPDSDKNSSFPHS